MVFRAEKQAKTLFAEQDIVILRSTFSYWEDRLLQVKLSRSEFLLGVFSWKILSERSVRIVRQKSKKETT